MASLIQRMTVIPAHGDRHSGAEGDRHSVIPAKATLSVIPAKAGIHLRLTPWTPVFTGVTRKSQKPTVIPAKATLSVIPAQRVIVIPAKAMLSVIPAKAGIHLRPTPWTPVFTGVTRTRSDLPDRHSRESESNVARHSRAEGDRHSRESDVVRHSGESRNPSSPRPLDSGFHRSDEPDDLPDRQKATLSVIPAKATLIRHSRESDVVRHSGESRNPSSPRPLDSGFHRSDESDDLPDRHSRAAR